MKLEKFKEKNKKKIFIIVFTVCCILLLAGVFLYRSFAFFTEDKALNIIKGKYEDPGDLYFAIYVDDNMVQEIPTKDSGYTLDEEKSSCTNGATISWDNINWTAIVNLSNYTKENMSRTKCTMHFKNTTFAEAVVDCGALGKDAGTCIKENNHLTTEVVSDETVDNNLRFVGADPNNYVWFNEELWRIIGVMNNIDDGTGKKETRLKIIRDESIGEYSWDNKANGVGSSTNDWGSNDWDDSALQIMLNEGAYWNRTSGTCPSGQNGATTSCDFSSNGLTEKAKQMISNVIWNLGGTKVYTTENDGLTKHFYTYERGTDVLEGRPTKWIGKVGLMYPSDYGYATDGGSAVNRGNCLANVLYNWNNASDCYNNNWLYMDAWQWTLTPNFSTSGTVFYITNSGNINRGHTDNTNNIFPVLYLKSSIKITAGEGSKENPYQLSL